MKFITDMKEGLNDVQNMLFEKNWNPFIRPLVLLLIVFIAVWYVNGVAGSKVWEAQRKVDAKKAEAESAKEYEDSKALYERLVKRLPDYSKKDEWLLSQMLSFFNKGGVEPTRTGRHILDEDGDFTHSSVDVNLELTYEQLGKLIELIENNEHFMRISNLTVSRAEGALGRLQAGLRVHTLFLKGNESSKSAK